MVLTFFAWIYIFLLTAGLGVLLSIGWSRIRQEPLPTLPVYQYSLLGFAMLTLVLGIYSLLAPINALPHLLLIAGVGAAIWRWPAAFRAAWQPRHACSRRMLIGGSLIGGIYVLGMLYWATMFPSNDDTAFYHSQTIKWLEHFSVVPGLGNLHGRLAFNSSFLQWTAFFAFTFLTGQPLFALNGYLFLLLLAAFLPALLQKPAKAPTSHLLTSLLFLLHYDFFPYWISSPTPDIGGMLLVCFITHLVLWQWERHPLTPAPFQSFAILLLVITSLTVKLSTVPALGLLVYLWYARQLPRQATTLFSMCLVLALILLPWLARNVLQTGYFIYPLPILDIWQVDWKVPLEAVITEKNIIHSAAIRPGFDWQSVLAIPFREWFPVWFQAHDLRYQLFMTAAVGSPAAMLAYLPMNKPAYPAAALRKRQLGLWAVYYAGFLFWFSNAPTLRFGLAFMHLSWLLPLYWWVWPYLKRYQGQAQLVMLVALVGLGLERLRDPVYLFRYQTAVMQKRIWLPEPQLAANLRQLPVHGGQVWVSINDVFCWYGPLPCTFQVQQGLAFRGRELSAGFRIEKKQEPPKK